MTSALQPTDSSSAVSERTISALTTATLPDLQLTLPVTDASVVLPNILDGAPWFFESPDCQKVMSPATGELLGQVSVLSAGAVSDIARTALSGFKQFRQVPRLQRAVILDNLALLLEAHQESLKRLIALEVGKPLKYAAIEVQRSIRLAQRYAERTRYLGYEERGEPRELDEGVEVYETLRPLGPVLAYTPFNFPLNLVMHKLAPAIGAGCSFVLKPTPRAPLTAYYLTRLAIAAGYDVISLVNLDNDAAAHLVARPEFKVFSFTGGAVGWDLARRAPVDTVKILELGSNAALIIEDLSPGMSVDSVAKKVAASAFGFAGQSCISTQRVYVNEALYPDFVDAMARAIANLKQGDVLDSGTDLGPMICPEASARTLAKVEAALQQGATLVGLEPSALKTSEGWLKPVVLTNTKPSMAVNADELFAPVVTVTPYTSFETALGLANQTALGLQFGIFTQSLAKAAQAQDVLLVRGLNINEVPSTRDDRLPYGGVGESGMGVEGVETGIESYSERVYRVHYKNV